MNNEHRPMSLPNCGFDETPNDVGTLSARWHQTEKPRLKSHCVQRSTQCLRHTVNHAHKLVSRMPKAPSVVPAKVDNEQIFACRSVAAAPAKAVDVSTI